MIGIYDDSGLGVGFVFPVQNQQNQSIWLSKPWTHDLGVVFLPV